MKVNGSNLSPNEQIKHPMCVCVYIYIYIYMKIATKSPIESKEDLR